MLDTDADRCGLVVPRQRDADGQWKDYEVLNRNRLIALLAVIFADQSPGCAFVTDSVTSLGLATFLANLGIDHVRYLKGYANVIGKAKELTDTGSCNAEVAIETSGHCAMQENDYQDDGTYTAVKVLSYLVQQTRRSRADSDGSGMDKMEKPATSPLLEAIAGLQEMPEVSELRMKAVDGSNESTSATFEVLEAAVVEACGDARVGWTLDDENLEGVRVNTSDEGSFFMLRQSLHDPILCLQIEATDKTAAREAVVGPLVAIMKKLGVEANLNTDSLAQY
uniref:Alpha-D-phosphohexomutase alpha/beta/alpha domain-containing protein n=1 Tax=Craspedostauros australis TaxID=1486917 RepID=A0A7R9WNF3_9STRA